MAAKKSALDKAENNVIVQESKMALFGRRRAALAEVGIDLDVIVDTYKYFAEIQKEDPELKIPTYRAKIPSGGGKSFDILTGDDSFDTSVKEFRGVVANFHNCNALFLNPEPNGEPPACSSPDGFKGLDSLSGEIKDCADCPNNQWGSGNGTRRGKACKNMRRLYILVEGSDMPIVLTLPPTSIIGWERYKSAVLGVQRLTPKDVVTEFALEVAVNSAGTKYSVVSFKVVGIIGDLAKETVKQLSGGESYVKDVVAEDYNTEPPETESNKTA